MPDWILFRTWILATGWPILLVGSGYLLYRTLKFYRQVGRSSFGRLVCVMVLGWLVTMYGLGVTATAFMWTDPQVGVPIVLPIFGGWLFLMVLVGWSVGRWSAEVSSINTFYQKLEDADRFKTDLINRTSHELSTPMTPLRIQVELLKNPQLGQLTEAQHRSVGIIERNLDRLAYLVTEMMDAARLQSGHLSMFREVVNLSTLVAEAVDAFEPQAHRAGITLQRHLETDLPVEVDSMRMGQVVQILVANAVKFTPAGGSVTVNARLQYGKALVEVADTGIGYETSDAPKLFQPFSQLPNHPPGSGAGLGLFIARSIIDGQAGSIWAESPGPGKGSTFSFAIPLHPAIYEEGDAPESPSPRAGLAQNLV